MGFWNLMVKKDDYLIFLANKTKRILNVLKNIHVFLSYKQIVDETNRDDVYVVLNGPSINEQSLELLEGHDVIFANRGFMHPAYSIIKPKVHVFIDPKILDGTWPTSWFDEIWSRSKNTQIVLPLEWKCLKIFKEYKNRILWFDFSLPFYNLGVSGACFDFAICQKYKNIYFTGFDGTYLGYELIKSSQTHFYGVDEELHNKSCKQFETDLYMFSRHLRDLNKLAEYAKKHKLNIINITKGGLLDMFERADFDSVL